MANRGINFLLDTNGVYVAELAANNTGKVTQRNTWDECLKCVDAIIWKVCAFEWAYQD